MSGKAKFRVNNEAGNRNRERLRKKGYIFNLRKDSLNSFFKKTAHFWVRCFNKKLDRKFIRYGYRAVAQNKQSSLLMEINLPKSLANLFQKFRQRVIAENPINNSNFACAFYKLQHRSSPFFIHITTAI